MNNETHLRQLERLAESDPNNVRARLGVLLARSRVEGLGLFFDLLKDRKTWNDTPSLIQDHSIGLVSSSLGADFEWLATETFKTIRHKHRVAVFRHRASTMLLHLIPGGAFTMGSTGHTWQRPTREVRVKPLLVGRYPVSQREWELFGQNRSHFRGADRPVENVSWADSQRWLSELGSSLRLPNEAEWEYAARAGTRTRFFWGDVVSPKYCWYRANSQRRTQPVNKHDKACNAFGLVDVSGNVWEWCEDSWLDSYEQAPTGYEPRLDPTVSSRASRGGGWGGSPDICLSTSRYGREPDQAASYVGLRVFRDALPKENC